MRTLISALALLLLAGCTSAQEAIQDVGKVREAVTKGGEILVTGIQWRDTESLEIIQDIVKAQRRAAEDLAAKGDLDGAEVIWKRSQKTLADYDPAGTKIDNLNRAIDKVKEMRSEPD